MKNCYLLSLIFSCVLLVSCSSSKDKDDETPKLPFSLKVLQENECRQTSPLSQATILVYDESPLVNPQSTYTTYITGEDGYIELDLDKESKVSFAIYNHFSNGDTKVYVFNDMDVDNYDLTQIFANEESLNNECGCESIDLYAGLTTGHSTDDILFASIKWGRNSYASNFEVVDQSTIVFQDVKICSDEKAILSAEVVSMTGSHIYGFTDKVSKSRLKSPLSLDYISDTNPVTLSDSTRYSVGLGLIQDDDYIFNYVFSNKPNSYPIYSSLPTDKTKLFLSKSMAIHSDILEESDIYYSASKERTHFHTSRDIADLTGMLSDTEVEWTPSFSGETMSWSTDASSQFDMSLWYLSFNRSNDTKIRMYIYGPSNPMLNRPKLTQDIETELGESVLYGQGFYAKKFDHLNSSSDAIKLTRFHSPEENYFNSFSRINFSYYAGKKNQKEVNDPDLK